MAINSQGTKLSHANSDSPSIFVQLEECKTITGPDGQANLIDVSHLGSVAKEFLPGLADSGQIQVECNFTAGPQQMDMLRMFNTNADAEEFRIEIPENAKRIKFHRFDFKAVVTKWGTAEAVDSAVKLTMTLQTSGGVQYHVPI